MTGLPPPPHVNVRSLAALHERQPAGADWAAWLSWATRQPSVASLGIEPQEFSDGRALVTMAGSMTPLNPDGGVDGGLVAALIDQVGALATLTRAAPGHGVLTCTLSISYLRPAMLPLTGVGQVVRSGRTLIFTRVDILSAADVCATASGTWLPKPYPAGVS